MLSQQSPQSPPRFEESIQSSGHVGSPARERETERERGKERNKQGVATIRHLHIL